MLLEFQTLFSGLTNILDSVYRGVGGWEVGGVGGGGGWGAVGGLFHTFEQKSSHCVFIEVHSHPQFACQAGTVADGSLIPSVALLVCPRGTTHSIVDCHEFLQGHRNDAGESRPGYL